jgi:hypothetical protein
LLWESFAFSRLETFAVLGLEVVHGDAEALSSRRGYKQGGFLQFRIMTGGSYFQAVNDGIVSHQELVCKITRHIWKSMSGGLVWAVQ